MGVTELSFSSLASHDKKQNKRDLKYALKLAEVLDTKRGRDTEIIVSGDI